MMSGIYFKRIQRKEGYEGRSEQKYGRNGIDHELLVVEVWFWVNKVHYTIFPTVI